MYIHTYMHMLPICVFYWCESHHSCSSFFCSEHACKLCVTLGIPVICHSQFGGVWVMLGLCIPQRHSESSPSFPIDGAWRNSPLGALANYEKVSWVQGQGCWAQLFAQGLTLHCCLNGYTEQDTPDCRPVGNTGHLPDFFLLLHPKLKSGSDCFAVHIVVAKEFVLLGLQRLWVWIFFLSPSLTFYPWFL